MDTVLVVNAGSSSIKFAAYDALRFPLGNSLVGRGHVSQVGEDLEFLVALGDHASGGLGPPVETWRRALDGGVFNHDDAMAAMFAWLDAHRSGMNVRGVGHRVVHGGQAHSGPVRVTDAVLRDLQALVPLAPLHQPHNLRAIRAAIVRWPAVPQVACFDTAFHSTQSPLARAYALPREITDAGVRRYGFHGLSYEYLSTQFPLVLGDAGLGKVVAAHLGNGASLCAIAGGRSVASSMGFSALDGLMMGTRSGTVDPGVLLYLMQDGRMTVQEVGDLLYRRSGLLGVSALSSDMQTLLASDDPYAGEAVDLFVHRIVCEIGALAAAMGGIDALVFSAGIGEHAPAIRARVAAGCRWLGVEVDERANVSGAQRIDASTSRVGVAVLPTDEEHMVALHTLRDLALTGH